MSLVPPPIPIIESKIQRGKKNKKKNGYDEESALKELQQILSSNNRKTCLCEAQIHGLVSNCLGCGRIVCESEGPGKCLTCGNLVLTKDQRSRLQKHISLMPETSQSGHGTDSSSNQRKVRVIDDHFDYFAVAEKSWISPTDRQRIQSEIDELQEAKYKRKLMLNVDVDNMTAELKSVPQIEDFNERIRQLQIKVNNTGGEIVADCTLNELVARESSKTFKFRYVPVNERHAKISKKQNESQGKNKTKQSHTNQTAPQNKRPPGYSRKAKPSTSKTNHKENK